MGGKGQCPQGQKLTQLSVHRVKKSTRYSPLKTKAAATVVQGVTVCPKLAAECGSVVHEGLALQPWRRLEERDHGTFLCGFHVHGSRWQDSACCSSRHICLSPCFPFIMVVESYPSGTTNPDKPSLVMVFYYNNRKVTNTFLFI